MRVLVIGMLSLVAFIVVVPRGVRGSESYTTHVGFWAPPAAAGGLRQGSSKRMRASHSKSSMAPSN